MSNSQTSLCCQNSGDLIPINILCKTTTNETTKPSGAKPRERATNSKYACCFVFFKLKSWCPELRTYFAFLTKQLLRLTGPSRRAPLSPDFAGSHVPREPKHPRAEPVARGRAAEPVGFRWNSDPENGSGKMRDRQTRWANVRPPNGGEKNTEKATLGWLTLFHLPP